jgi:hypothetical protein
MIATGVGRDPVRRGLMLVAWGMGVAVVLSLSSTLLVRWLVERSAEEGTGSIREALEAMRWIRIGHVALTDILVLAGCWFLTGALVEQARSWAYVATGGAAGRLAGVLLMFVLEQQWNQSVDALRLVMVCESAAGAVLWVGIGLALGALVRAGRRRAPWWAAIWIVGVVWDTAVVALQMIELGGGSTGPLAGGCWLYGVSIAVMLSQLVLVLAARRTLALGRPIGMRAPVSRQAQRAADGLSQFRSGLIARLLIACAAFGMVGFAMLARSQSLAGTVGLVLPIAEVLAATVMLVGLVRFAIHLPGDGGGSAIAGAACIALASLGQLYGCSIAWRIHSTSERAAGATSLWDARGIGDLTDAAQLLPLIDLATTVLALIGALFVLTALRSLARWLGRRDLESLAATLLAWAALLTVGVATVRYYLTTARHPGVGPVALAGLACLSGALAVFLQYTALLRSLVHALRGPPPVPAARLLTGIARPP